MHISVSQEHEGKGHQMAIVIPGPYSQPPIQTPKPESKPPPPTTPEIGKLEAPSKDVTPPDLTLSETWTDDKNNGDKPRWQSGPTITLDKPVVTVPDKPPPEIHNIPYVHPFTVNTGDIVEHVKLAISDLKAQHQAYNEMKTYIKEREGWIFSVASANDVGPDGDPFTDVQTKTRGDYSTGEYWLSEEEQYAGPSRELVTQLNTYQHQLLMAAADIITLVGQFNLAVDGAAYSYAQIDYSSQFPDAPVITEIHLNPGDGALT